MSFTSPFSDNRFEHEVRHLYYIPSVLYEKLEQAKPCYLIGARGTGKSTLLRSLSWRERVENENLKRQIAARQSNDFIGVYLKTPEVHVDVISQWLTNAPEILARGLYSRYLELVQLQEILATMAEIQVNDELGITASAEYALVANIFRRYKTELSLANVTQTPRSLADLSDSVRSIRRWIESASQQEINPSIVSETLGNPLSLGVFSNDICNDLARAIAKENAGRNIYFKVCFDEAEVLDGMANRIIATWIRLSKAPLFHTISYVSRPFNMADTCAPNLTVQSADANTVDLDDIQDTDFRKFAEGVVSLRLKEYFKKSSDDVSTKRYFNNFRFDCERTFGKLNLNFLLEDILKQSVSPAARQLLADSSRHHVAQQDKSRGGDSAALPIYETYLESVTGRQTLSSDEPKWRKRRNTSSTSRKAMVAACLSISHELKQDPRYAYADMILQISDSCIRDFLSNLHRIFERSGKNLIEFVDSDQIKPSIQDAGLKDASEAKHKSLPTHGLRSPSATAKLVTGIGRLTARLQTQSNDGVRHLKSTERGLFRLTLDQAQSSAHNAADLIIDAAEAGFLKIVLQEPLLLTFRLHTSLAPYFKTSYRGAYYINEISANEISRFALAEDDDDIDSAVTALFSRIEGINKVEPGLFDLDV